MNLNEDLWQKKFVTLLLIQSGRLPRSVIGLGELEDKKIFFDLIEDALSSKRFWDPKRRRLDGKK